MSWHKGQPVVGDASEGAGRPARASDYPDDALALQARHRQFRVLLEFSPDSIVILDEDGVVSEWNPAAEDLLGTPRLAAVGTHFQDLLFPSRGEEFHTAWKQLLAGQDAPRFEMQWGQGLGPGRKLGVIVAPIRSRGAFLGAVMILRISRAGDTESDSTLHREAGSQSHNTKPVLAVTDREGPAGLPGRQWLQRHLSEPPIARMERGAALFDIDVFPMVNVTYGPELADDVLNHFAAALKSLDTPGYFAHLRADVFVWVVDAVDAVTALNTCITAVNAALEEPFAVGDDKVWLTLNIGLATDTLVAGGDLLGAAKDALQAAREAPDSNVVYYDKAMEANASSSLRLASDLHHAIEQDELRLHYQPIMDLSTNEIAGVEALARWEHPGVGLIAPSDFIDAAERTGQIIPLGNWVVRTACNNALRLGSHSGGPRTMSINISARQLRDPNLITTLRDAMEDGKCAPSTIVIEVTESVLLHDLKTVAASLEAIKALDVGLDLDDFGTGYSSLQYLRNLPIDRLKVDQGFVAGLGVNGADTAIVASTIALAHALGLKAIAEGVETNEQLALLREMGCDFAQGYLLSRPADMESFTTWLDAYVPAAIPPTAAELAALQLQERTEVADLRDSKADRRQDNADRREANADRREKHVNDRDTVARERDDIADERDRIAGEREKIADEREQSEDDRERAGASGGERLKSDDSSSTRSSAKHRRISAIADRRVKGSERARAGKGRDEASVGRTSEADSRAEEKTDPPSGDGDA